MLSAEGWTRISFIAERFNPTEGEQTIGRS